MWLLNTKFRIMVPFGEEGRERNRIEKRENKEFHCNVLFLKKPWSKCSKILRFAIAESGSPKLIVLLSVPFCTFDLSHSINIRRENFCQEIFYKKKPKNDSVSGWGLACRVFITDQHWRREGKENQDWAGEKSRDCTGWPSPWGDF